MKLIVTTIALLASSSPAAFAGPSPVDLASLEGIYYGNVANDFDALSDCTVEISRRAFGGHAVTIRTKDGILFYDQANPEGATKVPEVTISTGPWGWEASGTPEDFSLRRDRTNYFRATHESWVARFHGLDRFNERGAFVQLSYDYSDFITFSGPKQSYQAQCGQLVKRMP